MIAIISPHGDDAIIGCYEVIMKHTMAKDRVVILYPDLLRVYSSTSRELKGMGIEYYIGEGSRQFFPEHNNCIAIQQYFVPDPYYEFHPAHRKWGMVGEQWLRDGKANVVFYSVNMQSPYIREVKDPEDKLALLERCFPEERSLWEHDHKYFLFEGQCQWVMQI